MNEKKKKGKKGTRQKKGCAERIEAEKSIGTCLAQNVRY